MLDFTWLDDQLAVGGRFDHHAAEELARTHGFSAIVDVRAEASDDQSVLAVHGLTLLHLPTPDLAAIAPEMLSRGTEFIAACFASSRRVLVHCEHGIGRSALLALCALVDRGLEPLAAIALAKHRRRCVSPSPAQYEAWCTWLASRGVAAPSFAAFARIAYAEHG